MRKLGFPPTGALGHRGFLLYFLSRLMSCGGMAFGTIGVAFAVLEIGGGARSLSIVMATTAVANLLALPLAGVLGDRYPRRNLLMLCNLAGFLAQAASSALVFAHAATVPLLACIGVFLGAARAVVTPATQGAVVEVLPKDLLRSGNALLSLANSVPAVVSGAFGGVLVAFAGPGWAIAADAAGRLAAAVLLIRVPAGSRGGRQGGLLAEVRAGGRALSAHRWLWSSIAAVAAVNVSWQVGFSMLGPATVAAAFPDGAKVWGFAASSLSLGLLTGGLLSIRVQPRRGLSTATFALLLVFLPLAALTAGMAPPWLFATAFAAGAAFEFYNVHWYSILQRRVPVSVLSKVISVDSIGTTAAIPFGYVVVGLVVGAAGTSVTVGVCAGVVLVAVLALLAFGRLGEARMPVPGTSHQAAEAASAASGAPSA